MIKKFLHINPLIKKQKPVQGSSCTTAEAINNVRLGIINKLKLECLKITVNLEEAKKNLKGLWHCINNGTIIKII